MPSYVDVVVGRLLLREATVGPETLWIALRDVAASGRGGRETTLLRALGARYLLDAEKARAARDQAVLVERAERARVWARLAFVRGLASAEVLKAEFEGVRREGFAQSLAARCVAQGHVPAAQAQALEHEADALLAPARARAAEGLREAIARLAPPFDAAQARHVEAGLTLVQTDALVATPPPRQAPAPAAPTAAAGPRDGECTDVMASTREVAPEDCPIYGYEIVRELGKGAMGVVYQARHVFTDRMTALKVLPLRLAAKTQYLERFKREAMALMRIDHDHVVRAYDFGGSEEYYYLALEFLEGETLDAVLRRDRLLPEARALEVARQVALGLGAAAAAGVVHRDVKPENVMLTGTGQAKLVDFGIVKLLDQEEGTVTMAGTTVGTPFYIAPEQARGEDDLDVRSDLYALGIMLFQLVTGQVPFTGKSQGAILVRHILEEVPDPRTVKPDVSPPVADVIRALTRKRRDDRPPTAEAAAEALAQALSALPA